MVPSHFVVTVSSAGTSVPLKASTVTLPTERFAARVTIQYDPTNAAGTKLYVGYGTAAADVSSTSYGVVLDSAIASVTLGLGQTNGNPIDMCTWRIDSSASGAKARCTPEQI